jgi:hypothetical protein
MLQVRAADLARSSLVFVGCLAQLTLNLPPFDMAPQCWQAVAEVLR